MALEYKDDDPGLDGEKYPEIIKTIQKEFSTIGEGITAMKKTHDEMHHNYEELKHQVDAIEKKFTEHGKEVPADIKAQIDKLATDITTRQEQLENNITERMDTQDVELQKKIDGMISVGQLDKEDKVVIGYVVKTDSTGRRMAEPVFGKEIDAARETLVARLALTRGKEGVKMDDVRQFEKELREGNRLEEVKAYWDSFNTYLRKGGEREPHFGLGSPEAQKALTLGSDPGGGYLVPVQMSAKIIERQFETDPIRQLAAVETCTTDALEWMVDIDEAGWGWEGETETGAETTTPDWRKKRIPVHVIYAKPRISQTLLEDAGINVEAWMAKKVADRFNRGEAAAFVTGDGVGKPRGFTTYANGTNWGQIEQVVVGTVAGSIDADGLIDTKYHLKEMYLGRGTWLMRRNTVQEVMQLKDGMGQYIWKPGLIGEDPLASSLLGLPVRMSPTMPAIAASSLSFALAEWTEAYMIVDRLGITIQRDPYTAKPLVELYTRKRVGGDVANFEAIKIGRVNP